MSELPGVHKTLGSISVIHTVPLHRETKFRASSGLTSLPPSWPLANKLALL